MARMMEKYRNEVLPALKNELGIDNVMAVPRLEKIVISMGIGQANAEKRRLELAQQELALIAGQKPVVVKAKKSVSNFKIREGWPAGLKVTLRGTQMYEFFDRLVSVTIPRVRDFRGLNPRGFDGRGNYSMGLTEQTVFLEVNPDKVEFQQGMNIAMITSAANDQHAYKLLEMMGVPFRKSESNESAA